MSEKTPNPPEKKPDETPLRKALTQLCQGLTPEQTAACEALVREGVEKILTGITDIIAKAQKKAEAKPATAEAKPAQKEIPA